MLFVREPDARLLEQELSAGLSRAIADLPEMERLTVRLHVMEGWPMEDLGAAIIRSRAQCDELLQSALAHLRLRLGRIFS